MAFKLSRTHFIFSFLTVGLLFAIHFNGSGMNISYLCYATVLLLMTAGIAIYPTLTSQGKISLNAPYLVCFAWIVWVFSSILWSESPLNSSVSAWIVSGFAFAFLLWAWIKPYLSEKTFFNLLLSITVFYALWAVIEFLLTSKSTFGPTTYQGSFGALFAPMLLPVTAYFIQDSNKPRLKIALLFLLLLALFSTYSRGAILSYLITLPILFFIAYKQQFNIRKPAITLLLLSIGSYLCIYGYAHLTHGQSFAAKIPVTGKIEAVSSIDARFMLYQSMWEIFKQYPLLGTGIASFRVMYPSVKNPAESSAGMYGHNDYLQFLHEGGVVLLILLILPLCLQASILLKSCRLNLLKQPLITAGFVLASSTFFIHAAVDFIFYIFILALLAGFYLAMAYQQLPPVNEQKSMVIENPKFFLGISGLAVSVLWAILAVNSYISHKMEWQVVWGHAHAPEELTAEQLLFYHTLSPEHTYPLMQLSQFYYSMTTENSNAEQQQQYLSQAVDYTTKLLKYAPRYSHYYVNLAQLVHLFPQIEKDLVRQMPYFHFQASPSVEEQLLLYAVKCDPSFSRATFALAEFYIAQKKTTQALATLTAAKIWHNGSQAVSAVETPQNPNLEGQKITSLIAKLSKK